MNAYIYRNNKTNYPIWSSKLHEHYPIGMGYHDEQYFVHYYVGNMQLYNTSTEKIANNKTFNDWLNERFSASDIRDVKNLVGEVIAGVWRPGLFYTSETLQALGLDEHMLRSAEQDLRILLEKFSDILLYIEPSQNSLYTFSHKTRELLILACTNVEDVWKQYMRLSGIKKERLTTNDYVKLCDQLFLKEYELKLSPYKEVDSINPFATWNNAEPTASLPWYESYNKIKHDRTNNFSEGTLLNCIYAIAANIVLFCVRYSPFPLFQGAGLLSAMVNQLFKLNLVNSDPITFYVPRITLDYQKGSQSGYTPSGTWISKPFSLMKT